MDDLEFDWFVFSEAEDNETNGISSSPCDDVENLTISAQKPEKKKKTVQKRSIKYVDALKVNYNVKKIE